MELKDIIEAILFNSQKPLTPQELRAILSDTAEKSEEPTSKPFKKTPLENIETALHQIQRELEEFKHTYRLVCVAGSWQFVTQPEFAPWLKVMLGIKSRPPRLSQPALETLAVIAYRQPATRAEIEQVRGVAVDGVMQTLIERGLVEQVGRAEVLGRPSLYGTTQAFLEYFGLSGLDELPGGDELRRIPVQKPETLLTVEPGLASAPPESLTSTENTATANEAASAVTESKPEEVKPEEKSGEKSAEPAGETPQM